MRRPAPPRPTKKFSRFRWLGVGAATLLTIGTGWLLAREERPAIPITVYKSPSCECCTGWVAHLRHNGFTVTVEKRDDMEAVKGQFGVPNGVTSCHTAVVGDYVVEGHVPAGDLHRLLQEHPAVQGIAAPGMPVGSPGMEIPGEKPEPYQVVTFNRDGTTHVFANH